MLVAEATNLAARRYVTVLAMVVDGKDAALKAVYRHHGSAAYGSSKGKLLSPLASLVPRSI